MSQIEKIARTLGISLESAKKLMEDDKRIDDGQRCEWEPSLEEERRLRKINKVDVVRKKTENMKRTIDEDKLMIIELLRDALTEATSDINVTNAEKTIHFSCNGANYSINLTKHHS